MSTCPSWCWRCKNHNLVPSSLARRPYHKQQQQQNSSPSYNLIIHKELNHQRNLCKKPSNLLDSTSEPQITPKFLRPPIYTYLQTQWHTTKLSKSSTTLSSLPLVSQYLSPAMPDNLPANKSPPLTCSTAIDHSIIYPPSCQHTPKKSKDVRKKKRQWR